MGHEGHKPQRTCLGCRQVRDQQDLLRFVLAPAGDVLVDYRGRLPGRGAYTCLSRECLRVAVQRRQFQRVFKNPSLVVDADQLIRELLAAIETKIVNLLGMAKKSGMTLSGGKLVLDALANPGQVAVIMLADDVSAGIGDKLAGSAAARGVPCWRLLDKERLGRMLGKGERSVVALKSGALAKSVTAEMLRYKKIAGES